VHDEKGLVERARKNDPDAVAQIYEEHFDRIYRYVFVKVESHTEAEDLTQQVFLNMIQSISSFKWKGASFSSWLFRIAHNQVIDYYRKASRVQVAPVEVPLAAPDHDPADVADQEMEIERVKDTLGTLTPSQQEVITLRFTGELSTAETAKIMGKSEGAVKVLQHSALAALRKKLSAGRNHGQEV